MEENKVKVGYTYSDEDGYDIEVIFIYELWCILKIEGKHKPFVLPLDYVQSIKDDSENITNAIN